MIPLKFTYQTPHHHRRWPVRQPRTSPPGANAELTAIRDAVLLGEVSPSVELAFHRQYHAFSLKWRGRT